MSQPNSNRLDTRSNFNLCLPSYLEGGDALVEVGPVGDLAVVDGSGFDPVGVVLPVFHPLAPPDLLAAPAGLESLESNFEVLMF